MSGSFARYQSRDGEELSLTLDVDLKSEKIMDLIFKGTLVDHHQIEINHFKAQVLNNTVSNAYHLKRSSFDDKLNATTSLLQWLLSKAIENYRGETHLEFQKDCICLCYGIGINDIKKEVLARPDYELSHLIAETKATSACGSCRLQIIELLKNLREEYGLIKGLSHSKSHLDSHGHWLKIKNMYPAQLIIHLDELKKTWMLREGLVEQFMIELINIEGYHIQVSINDLKNPDQQIDKKRSEAILAALSDYWRGEVGALFFLTLS